MICATLPSASITKVERSYEFLPSRPTPYGSASLCSGSASSVNGSPYFALNRSCDACVVGADAEDLGARPLELALGVADPAGLPRAAGRVVLGIEVEDDRLAAQVGELHGLAAVALELEVRCRLAFLDHAGILDAAKSGIGGASYAGSREARSPDDMNPTLRGFLIIGADRGGRSSSSQLETDAHGALLARPDRLLPRDRLLRLPALARPARGDLDVVEPLARRLLRRRGR
mgnify:CR=1 FL=1